MELSARLALLLFTAGSWTTGRQTAEPPQLHMAQLERRMFDAINEQRANARLKPLRWDERLMRVARTHSEDMVRRQFFDHVNPDGDDPTARGRRAGYQCRKTIDGTSYREGLAENLFEEPRFSSVQITGTHRVYKWNTSDDIVKQSIDGWMRSPGHRRNVLETAYTLSAIGIAVSNDDVYITQLFC